MSRIRKGRNKEIGTRWKRSVARQIEVSTAGRCFKTTKHCYPTIEIARKMAKTFRKKVGPKLEAYHCLYCKQFHVGHWRPPERRRADPWGDGEWITRKKNKNVLE